MKYIDVKWHHSHEDETIRLVSEVGADGFEVRKLEFFRDGRVGFASQESNSDSTRLGVAVMPDLSEINLQQEFTGTSIDAAAFEELWRRYAAKSI
jgi:hypothetical protein